MGARSLICMVTGLLLVASLPVRAHEEELTIVRSARPVSFAAIRTMPGLISLTFIDVDRRFLVVARRTVRSRGLEPPWRKAPGSEGPVSSVLHFYRRQGDHFFKIADSDPGYIFEGMSAERGEETDRLFTYWVTGSAKAVIIFAVHGQQIAKVFSWGGKLSPEFIGLGNDGETYLVVTDGRIMEADGKTTYPKTASIYAWDGRRYVLRKEVPWEHRFEALKDHWPREFPKE